MGGSLLHAIGLLFSVASLVLLIFVNIGTTFSSSFLPNVYLVELSYGTSSLRFGPYNTCVLDGGKTLCTKPVLAQALDSSSYGINGINNVDINSLEKISKAYQCIVLIIPATAFAFISMCGWLTIRQNRKGNRLPMVGAFASIFGVICSAATLALVMVCYPVIFKAIQNQVHVVYHWGSSIYLLGVGGCGSLLVSFILYVIVCLRFKNDDDYTYFQKDEYNNYGDHRHYY